MVRKIKVKKNLTEEEQAAADREKQMEAAGIQDEFQAKGFEMVDWMQEHSKLVMGCIGVVVIAGIVVAGVSNAGASSDLAASAAYETAIENLSKPVATEGEASDDAFATETERNQAALSALDKMATAHSGSNVSVLASLRAAQIATDLGEHAKALTFYQNLQGHVQSNDPLQAKILMGLAFAYDGNKDAKSAAATFQKLVDMPGDLNEDTGLWQSARLYKSLGQNEAALKNAEQLVAQYPTSSLKKDAEGLIASIGQAKPAAAAKPTEQPKAKAAP